MSHPGIRARRWGLPLFLVAYAALLAVAELAVVYVNPVLVFPLHGGLIGLLVLSYAGLHPAAAAEDRSSQLAAVFLALLLVPLIRIISLTLPLGAIEAPYRYVAAGFPMAVGAFLVARAAGMTRQDIGLRWSQTGWQVAVVVLSVGFGFVEYLILQSAPMGAAPWTVTGVAPALAVGIFTGFPEELLFRGVLQTALRPFIGRWNFVYVSLLFATMHVGYMSVTDLVFVFAVGLAYGWVFEKTRSIVGISIGHGVANVVLFFVAPYLLPLALPLTLP